MFRTLDLQGYDVKRPRRQQVNVEAFRGRGGNVLAILSERRSSVWGPCTARKQFMGAFLVSCCEHASHSSASCAPVLRVLALDLDGDIIVSE